MVVHATYMYSEWLGYVLHMSPYIPHIQNYSKTQTSFSCSLAFVPNKWGFHMAILKSHLQISSATFTSQKVMLIPQGDSSNLNDNTQQLLLRNKG